MKSQHFRHQHAKRRYGLLIALMCSFLLIDVRLGVACIVSYALLELVLHWGLHRLRARFQWLITSRDRFPQFSKTLLDKYFADGFDAELGWSRKANTTKHEMGKYGQTTYHINGVGARLNPNHEHLPIKIATFGDSFTFGRQVNDHETYQFYLSRLTQSNVVNYGVGNYGFDQALLRLKREYSQVRAPIVIMGIVPSTIVRILGVWKHYNEYGNTLAFKPRFELHNHQLKLIPNIINTREKFENYQHYLPIINQHDDFYQSKFQHEMLQFPYLYSLIKAWPRHTVLLGNIIRDMKVGQGFKCSVANIMDVNLTLRKNCFADQDDVNLLLALIQDFVAYAKMQQFEPVLAWLPQKDDVLTYLLGERYYDDFITQAKAMLNVVDLTPKLVTLDNLDELYSDDSIYGGHFSREGNQMVASCLYDALYKTNRSELATTSHSRTEAQPELIV